METARLTYLIEKISAKEATSAEFKELLDAIHDDANGEVTAQIDAFHHRNELAAIPYNYEHWQAIAQKILDVDKNVNEHNVAQSTPVRRLHARWKSVAAAIVILLLGSGVYLYFNHTPKKEIAATKNTQDIKAPSVAKATIRLSNGNVIQLDTAHAGSLAVQGNVSVTKDDAGQIAYTAQGKQNTATGTNALSNPRGSPVINLTLSDGSKVWLNAASSIEYPAEFTGTQRKVTINGEAYFEVAHNPKMPFRVSAKNTTVTVLGTHFNVKAYDDEAMKVTLLEGSVNVSLSQGNKPNETSKTITPGQQVVVDPSKDELVLNEHPNLDEVMAWKEGLFHFESADLKTILQEYARWYDIEVIYEGTVSNEKYFSIMKRSSSLANVLQSLQANQVQFEIKGRTLYIRSQ